jgi:hypothetical protein
MGELTPKEHCLAIAAKYTPAKSRANLFDGSASTELANPGNYGLNGGCGAMESLALAVFW